MGAIEFEGVQLGAPCASCGEQLGLDETGSNAFVGCPRCDDPAVGKGATVADALDNYLSKHPAPSFLPSALVDFVVPKQTPWVIECDGFPFETLTAAAEYADSVGGATIYCRSAAKKAANQ